MHRMFRLRVAIGSSRVGGVATRAGARLTHDNDESTTLLTNTGHLHATEHLALITVRCGLMTTRPTL